MRHRIYNIKMQVMQRGLGGSHASECTASINRRGCGCDLLPHFVEDGGYIGESRTGILAGSDASLEIGLDGLQIRDDMASASEALAPFADRILPQAAFQEARRIVEECSRVRECRGRRIRCRHALYLS